MAPPLDSVVIGAGQAGLSASYHLTRLGLSHVVLDADPAPGGAWRHRWDSLTMHDVHGVAALPGSPPPAADPTRAANTAASAYFAAYEREHDLPVRRPVRVDDVRSADADPRAALEVRAGGTRWRTRTVVNATGTWTQPYWPAYPGREVFVGLQVHTRDYPGAEAFRGLRTVVVGGGASAVQLLGEIALVTDTLWVTRRPPVWRTDDFTPEAGRAAVALVEDRVRRGLPPASVVSVTGLALREQERGAYERRPMFARLEPDGVRWADGSFEAAQAIVWATGFRPALRHLAALGLRGEHGGIALDGTTSRVDPRVQLVGYGPSASTIGANRAGRVAATSVRSYLEAPSLSTGAAPSPRTSAVSSPRPGRSGGSTRDPLRT